VLFGLILILGTSTAWCAGNVAAQAQQPDRSGRLQTFLDKLDTFSAGFQQVVFDAKGNVEEKSVGVMYLKRPGEFHWSYWEPYSEEIISDGRTIWVYDKDLKQVTIKDAASSIGDSPAAVLAGNVDINKYYVVIDMGVTDATDWLELTPRDVNSQYKSVRLGFSGDKLSAMILFDDLGNKTQINFLNARVNMHLDDALFRFTPPKGVDVIDGRGNAPP
jgi:outer membrane lipoprotein carrier protein